MKKIIYSLILFWLFLMPVSLYAQTATDCIKTTCEPLKQTDCGQECKIKYDICVQNCNAKDQATQTKTNEKVKDNSKYYFTPNVSIGEIRGNIEVSPDLLGKYIKTWYGFLVAIAGILATLMIMYAGVKWVTSRGGGAISQAKEIMLAAVTGLALVFLSYSILALINPGLLTITMPKLDDIQYSGDFLLPSGNMGELDADGVGGGGGNIPAADPTTLVGSSNINDFQAKPELITAAESLINQLREEGKLPEGFHFTNAYRNDPGSWHISGLAVDMTWPGITRESATAFVNEVRRINPNFTTIIEFDGEYGSHWREGGVHLDLRPIEQHRNLD
ncbi:MAG: pilin [Candidatus Buchananbacteria bacterium]